MTKSRIHRDFDEYLLEKLKDPKDAQLFLNTALEEYQMHQDIEAFYLALEMVIKAKGSVAQFSKEADMNRSHLYKIFNNEVEPQFNTISTILNSLGFKLSIKKSKKKPA